MVAVKVQEKAEARPFDIMLPGMKMARVWLNEDGSPKMFEVKVPMLRHIWHVELAQNGDVAKAVDLGMSGAVEAKLAISKAPELREQLKETLKTFDAETIRRTQERGKAWSW